MTKRFRYDSALEKVYNDNTFNNGTTESYGVFECCEIMNEQQEMIQDLSESLSVASNREIRKDKLIENLQKENEQLKSDLKELKEIGDYQSGRIDELNNENDQLKQSVDNIYREVTPTTTTTEVIVKLQGLLFNANDFNNTENEKK